jgi:hypothetical protein
VTTFPSFSLGSISLSRPPLWFGYAILALFIALSLLSLGQGKPSKLLPDDGKSAVHSSVAAVDAPSCRLPPTTGPGLPALAGGDTPQYLNAAYHIFHHATFTQSSDIGPSTPAVGREPGYAVFLAGLMAISPSYRTFTPNCLAAGGGCDRRIYRIISQANVALIMLSGICMFAVGRLATQNTWGGLIAAGYMLFNVQMNKGWSDPASDRLAVFFVSLSLLAITVAWRKNTLGSWANVGFVMAALTLTKAIFLWYVMLGAIAFLIFVCLSSSRRRRSIGLAFSAGVIIYVIAVGGWMARNRSIEGEARLTDLRSGVALSTREVFDHMTPTQYLASFLYWMRGPGAGLAKKLFPPEVVAPFDLDQCDGFYDRGQNGYFRRLGALQRAGDHNPYTAGKVLDHEIEHSILERPLTHLATTAPLFYRGIWIDEFIVVGLPVFFWMGFRAIRRRQTLRLVLLSVGAFNLLFYAVFSLNIPRYQMTAVPAFALAAALAAVDAIRSDRGKLLQMRGGSRAFPQEFTQ